MTKVLADGGTAQGVRGSREIVILDLLDEIGKLSKDIFAGFS